MLDFLCSMDGTGCSFVGTILDPMAVRYGVQNGYGLFHLVATHGRVHAQADATRCQRCCWVPGSHNGQSVTDGSAHYGSEGKLRYQQYFRTISAYPTLAGK